MDQDQPKDWRELCKAAATELDPAKLMNLIAELTKALDERSKKRKLPAEPANEKKDLARSWQSELAM